MELSSETQTERKLEENVSSKERRNLKHQLKPTIPKGKPKSGRIWKTEKKRFSSLIKTKGLKSSLKKKQALQEELKRIKEASKAIIAAKEEEKQKKKERRRENLKRREENIRKSEVVQVIKNPAKIKKMKRKQLRYIEKRDTNDM